MLRIAFTSLFTTLIVLVAPAALGAPVSSSPDEFGQFVRLEIEQWAKLTREMNLR